MVHAVREKRFWQEHDGGGKRYEFKRDWLSIWEVNRHFTLLGVPLLSGEILIGLSCRDQDGLRYHEEPVCHGNCHLMSRNGQTLSVGLGLNISLLPLANTLTAGTPARFDNAIGSSRFGMVARAPKGGKAATVAVMAAAAAVRALRLVRDLVPAQARDHAAPRPALLPTVCRPKRSAVMLVSHPLPRAAPMGAVCTRTIAYPRSAACQPRLPVCTSAARPPVHPAHQLRQAPTMPPPGR